MLQLSEFFGTGRVILLVGAILLYVCSRVGAGELEGFEHRSAGRRAMANWFPIAAAAVVAIAIHRADWALSIIFATSIGCLSLLVGAISLVSPDYDTAPAERRLWPFLLPAALLALLVGFTGNLSWRNAGLLLIEGAALLYAWVEWSASREAVIRVRHVNFRDFRWVNTAICIVMGLIGAIALVIGTQRISEEAAQVPGATVVVTVLAPLLILPMLTAGADLAKKNRTAEALTSAIAVVLLNLCLLLPMTALLWYPAQTVSGSVLTKITIHPGAIRDATPMPFGWVTWRVDNVLLVVLAIALFPAALGRWRLGRAEGLALIALYGAYVLMETAGSLRWL